MRVTVHSLRKRLMEVYLNEGASHTVRLVMPPGHYAPSFVHQSSVDGVQAASPEQLTSFAREISPPDAPVEAGIANQKPSRRGWLAFLPWLIAGLLLTAVTVAAWVGSREWKKERLARTSISTSLPTPGPQGTIHALMGSDRRPYVDHSGNTWSAANYCQGGTNITVPPQRIEGTEDAPLYFGGVRGIAHDLLRRKIVQKRLRNCWSRGIAPYLPSGLHCVQLQALRSPLHSIPDR